MHTPAIGCHHVNLSLFELITGLSGVVQDYWNIIASDLDIILHIGAASFSGVVHGNTTLDIAMVGALDGSELIAGVSGVVQDG